MAEQPLKNDDDFSIKDSEETPTSGYKDMPDAAAADITVEDIPDLEERVHDQLPSPEEYKANMDTTPKVMNKKNWTYLMICAVMVVLIVVVSSVTSTSSSDDYDEAPSQRLEATIQFLFDNDISNLPSLKDKTSPQHRAAAFIADGDLYQMELSPDNVNRFAERYVLALIFYHTHGQDWSHRLNFLSSSDHCSWYHKFMTTAGKEVRSGVKCDVDGRVVELNLSWNLLKANSIPSEVKWLAKMTTLHMYGNPGLSGYFPSIFKEMPNLKGIALMKTNMQGTIPEWIGDMKQLTTLALSNNALRGSLPASISNLKNLKLLALDGNTLEGDIGLIKGLTNLQGLFLDDNKIMGDLEDFENLKKLISLDLSHNQIYGTMPEKLMNLPSLEVLDVSHNSLDGKFPEDIMENNKLEYFSVADNAFSGTLTARIGFVKSLKHIDISDNELTGTIPDTIEQLTDLKYFSTSRNPFGTQNMLDFSRLTDLVDLAMANNNIHGTISTSIGSLSNLVMLDMKGNGLTGSIPPQIQRMLKLNFLLLNRNKLSGDLPIELNWLHKLQVLLLDKNDFKASASRLCEAHLPLTVFVADCYPGANSQTPEVDCHCCTQCCMDLDYDCNNKEWTADVDLEVEYGYQRDKYTFSIRDVPVTDSDNQDDSAEPSDPNVAL